MNKMRKIAFAVVILTAAFLVGNVQSAYAQRGEGEMTWRGTVDDTIQVVIRNRNVRVKHIKGRTYNDDGFDFDGRAPRRNGNVSVDKKDGRGRVFIFQQPSRRNNYTTIVQVEDPKSGADRYRFELRWN